MERNELFFSETDEEKSGLTRKERCAFRAI